jgi:Spy/CpxP family protein refolding chaperone
MPPVISGAVRAALWAAVLVVGVAPPVGAQSPVDAWWKTPGVRAALSLTPRQAEQVDAIFRESLPLRRDLRKQLAAQQRRVSKMFLHGPFDDERARVEVARLFSIDKEHHVARTWMLARMYRILTPLQRAKLEQLPARVPMP